MIPFFKLFEKQAESDLTCTAAVIYQQKLLGRPIQKILECQPTADDGYQRHRPAASIT